MAADAVTQAVNFAILVAHRLGEPRVLELSQPQYRALRRSTDPADWTLRGAYRGLRVVRTAAGEGRVLVWDRMRETQMVQRIDWRAER